MGNQIMRTEHGDNIATQIDRDAYGNWGQLTEADAWHILDQMQTHFIGVNNLLAVQLGNLMLWLTERHDIKTT